MQSIFTLGNLTIDDIVLLNEGRLYLESSGGDALFSAIGAWIWRQPVGLVARVGQGYPQTNIERIQAAGIACHLRRVPGNDIRNWALYEPDGSRQFLNHACSGSYEQMSITGEEIPEECLGAAGYHIAPMPVTAQASMVRRLRDPLPTSPIIHKPKNRAGVEQRYPLITLDTFPQHLGTQNEIDAALGLVGQVDAFLPSREEAAILCGSDDPHAAARAFAALGAPLVCIKMGAKGALLYQAREDTFHHIPIYPVDTVDPTGAGDAFCGGFLAGLLAGGDPVWAACCGAVSASYVVEQVGALNLLAAERTDRDKRLDSLIQAAGAG